MDQTKKLLKDINGRFNPPKLQAIATDMYLPNHSGTHDAGILNKTPSKDNDLVNKKYVDDVVSGVIVTETDPVFSSWLSTTPPAYASNIGTWGALDYPTWASGTPFVKMTDDGTFALDTNTYLTSSDLSDYALLDGTNQPFTGNLKIGDNLKHYFGTGNDASITYDGTNLLINPQEVGTGATSFTGNVGIGTTSPGAALDVNGAITSNSGYSGSEHFGLSSVLSGVSATAIGFEAKAKIGCTAIGRNANASTGTGYNFAMGYYSISSGYRSFAVGWNATSSNNDTIAFGYNSLASKPNAMAFGSGAQAKHDNTVAFGAGTVSTVANQFIIGNSTIGMGLTIPNGNVGIGTTTPTGRLNVLYTTEQLRLSYDVSNYLSATVGSTGNATLALTGTTPTFSFSNSIKIPSDSNKILFGAGDDASIRYDGTDLCINTKEVGSGTLKINGVAAVSGSFTTADGKTVTVTDGIITAIV